MLPIVHHQAYQALLDKLLALQTAIAANRDIAKIDQEFQASQQVFQAQVTNLGSSELDPKMFPRWQSLQTEIYRAMRLLSTDIIFLRSSRQATTFKQREATMLERVEKLIDYCQAMLQQ